MTVTWKRLAASLPSLALAVAAVSLACNTLSGSSLASTPKAAPLVNPAPEALSSVAVSRDWTEVSVSGSKGGNIYGSRP